MNKLTTKIIVILGIAAAMFIFAGCSMSVMGANETALHESQVSMQESEAADAMFASVPGVIVIPQPTGYFSKTLDNGLYGIGIKYGSWIDSVTILTKDNYGYYDAYRYGGNGGHSYKELILRSGEYIKKVTVKSGAYVDRITIQTNQRTWYAGGNGGSSTKSVSFNNAADLERISGRANTYLESITFHKKPADWWPFW
jgi:hypothetical protein